MRFLRNGITGFMIALFAWMGIATSEDKEPYPEAPLQANIGFQGDSIILISNLDTFAWTSYEMQLTSWELTSTPNDTLFYHHTYSAWEELDIGKTALLHTDSLSNWNDEAYKTTLTPYRAVIFITHAEKFFVFEKKF